MNKPQRMLVNLALLLSVVLAYGQWRDILPTIQVVAQDTQKALPKTVTIHPDPIIDADRSSLQIAVRGKLKPFELKRNDLKTSVFAHPVPKLSLIFFQPGRNSTKVKVELPREIERPLMTYWHVRLAYYYKREIEPTADLRTRIKEDMALAAASSRLEAELQAMTIQTPKGRRNISTHEAGRILEFISNAAKSVIQQAEEYKKATPMT